MKNDILPSHKKNFCWLYQIYIMIYMITSWYLHTI